MKLLILNLFVVALLLTAIFVVEANAGLVIGSSGSQFTATDSDPNEPMPEAMPSIRQQLIRVDVDPNGPESTPMPE